MQKEPHKFYIWMCFFHHALKIRVFLVLVCMSVLFSILVKNIAGHVLPAPPIPLPLTGSTGPDQMFAWGFKEKGYYVIKKAIGPDFWFLFCCRRHVGQAFFHDQTCKIILFLELEQYINYCHGHISPVFFFSKFYNLLFHILVCSMYLDSNSSSIDKSSVSDSNLWYIVLKW